jgi:hypothetical protein
MSDQLQQPHGDRGANDGFEREDLGPKTVYAFLIILGVIVVLVFFAVNGVYRVLDGYYRTHQAAESLLKPEVGSDTRELQTPQVKQQIGSTFPQPLLETDERNELNDFRMQEANQLNSYGWVDQKAGVAHIPIERAMQLIAERGLPVQPSGANSGSSEKTTVDKKTAVSKPAK